MMLSAKVEKKKVGEKDIQWLGRILGNASLKRWHPSLDLKVMHISGKEGETARKAVWLEQWSRGKKRRREDKRGGRSARPCKGSIQHQRLRLWFWWGEGALKRVLRRVVTWLDLCCKRLTLLKIGKIRNKNSWRPLRLVGWEMDQSVGRSGGEKWSDSPSTLKVGASRICC